jgi:Na+-driven multidrug efflux pump
LLAPQLAVWRAASCEGPRAGAGKPKHAKHAVGLALATTGVFVIAYLTLLIPGRHALSRVFLPYVERGSGELAVMSDCLLLIAAGAVADWTNCTLSGVLHGTGRQLRGAQIYACTHWVLGPILLWLFAFKWRWGVRGIWGALAVISNVQIVAMVVRSLRLRPRLFLQFWRFLSVSTTCGATR